MAKRLLGKEVTAALNEKIKAQVAELQGKGVNPTLCIIRVGENEQPNVVRLWALPVRKSFFRLTFLRKSSFL